MKTNFTQLVVSVTSAIPPRTVLMDMLPITEVNLLRGLKDVLVDLEGLLQQDGYDFFRPGSNWDSVNAHLNRVAVMGSTLLGLVSKSIQIPCPMSEVEVQLRKKLQAIAELVESKDAQYGSSWCARGGVGAFFVSIRKVDRLKVQTKNFTDPSNFYVVSSEDLSDTLSDLVGYFMLISETRAQLACEPSSGYVSQ